MRLYVGNISFDVSETDLKETFESFGTVTDVKIMMDRETNRSRGFGFVTMSGASEGSAAMSAMDGKPMAGRNLTVNEARPREERGERATSGSRRY